MKKIALVLSGGGFKGAFQVGALQYLRENWDRIAPHRPPLSFDIVAGVSVGSLNGLMVALDKFDDLVQLWDDVAERGVSEIYTSDFIDTSTDPNDPNPELKFRLDWNTLRDRFPRTTRNLLLRAIFNRQSLLRTFTAEFQQFKSIADNTPLQRKLNRLAKRGEIRDTVFKCGFVSLRDGKYYSLDQNDFKSDLDFANGVLASTAMPIIWSPVNGVATNRGIPESLVDGGIRDVSPLGDVIDEIVKDDSPEDYTIVIINCSSGKVTEENFLDKNIVQIALRALVDIAITEIFNNDIREFMDKNYILEQFKRKLPGEDLYDYDYDTGGRGNKLKFFNALVIQPESNILGDTLTASRPLIEYRLAHGRARAEIALNVHLNKTGGNKMTVV
ncbi:patatin-like phospholipase family protein [Neolewinella litorea]|uniref:Patatin-like phospholipase family protein n=1 Tax=Neolewinella litorea TaxID=2562452 RepID=A0A4S4NAR2_9BACT|nr:patatin-like phospholipase family protein [Neolewinella litorea]THH36446.1 patatin-like phospholipase family protein [Neolewinella litorea]